MADDLKNRGGGVDVAELSMQLGSPVALVSASKGEGFDKVLQFLAGTTQSAPQAPPLMQLPVIQDIPKCRAWAANVGTKGTYQAPAPPHWTRRLDAIFLLPVMGPVIFILVVIAVFQSIFLGQTGDGRVKAPSRPWEPGGLHDSQPYSAFAGGRRNL